jgi:hypothetical protein
MLLTLASAPTQNDYAVTQLSLALLSLMIEAHPSLLAVIGKASYVDSPLSTVIVSKSEINAHLCTSSTRVANSGSTIFTRVSSKSKLRVQDSQMPAALTN